jgi:hypothetical protein
MKISESLSKYTESTELQKTVALLLLMSLISLIYGKESRTESSQINTEGKRLHFHKDMNAKVYKLDYPK